MYWVDSGKGEGGEGGPRCTENGEGKGQGEEGSREVEDAPSVE